MKKVAIITGASGNLGKASVEKFLSEGYKIVATVTPGKKLGFEVTGEVETYDVDLTNEGRVSDIIEQIIKKHERVDAALLLVGAFTMGGVADTDGAALKKMYSLNFETAYFTARPVFLQMMKQSFGGRIIMVGSRPALKPTEGRKSVAYSLAKASLFKLADFFNAEGTSKNVVTSVIVPGVIDTPPNRKDMPQANFANWVQPEEIAETMAFLCSEKASVLREPVIKVYGNS
jgi:NAD(P)-dependent dehydrogenase (short-subunit alcohol dehydrogenase family)